MKKTPLSDSLISASDKLLDSRLSDRFSKDKSQHALSLGTRARHGANREACDLRLVKWLPLGVTGLELADDEEKTKVKMKVRRWDMWRKTTIR